MVGWNYLLKLFSGRLELFTETIQWSAGTLPGEDRPGDSGGDLKIHMYQQVQRARRETKLFVGGFKGEKIVVLVCRL